MSRCHDRHRCESWNDQCEGFFQDAAPFVFNGNTNNTTSVSAPRVSVSALEPNPEPCLYLAQLFASLTLPKAAFRLLASFPASSFAQKCMKNSRGCSVSMWL